MSERIARAYIQVHRRGPEEEHRRRVCPERSRRAAAPQHISAFPPPSLSRDLPNAMPRVVSIVQPDGEDSFYLNTIKECRAGPEDDPLVHKSAVADLLGRGRRQRMLAGARADRGGCSPREEDSAAFRAVPVRDKSSRKSSRCSDFHFAWWSADTSSWERWVGAYARLILNCCFRSSSCRTWAARTRRGLTRSTSSASLSCTCPVRSSYWLCLPTHHCRGTRDVSGLKKVEDE